MHRYPVELHLEPSDTFLSAGCQCCHMVLNPSAAKVMCSVPGINAYVSSADSVVAAQLPVVGNLIASPLMRYQMVPSPL